MAAHVRYVRTRDGVYQYERRVPARVQRDARRFSDAFGGKHLFRRSLGTKDAGEMFSAAQVVHEEFEQLVSGANGKVGRRLTPIHNPMRNVTDEDLAAICDRYTGVIAEPFERMRRLANVDAAAAAEFDRMTDAFESDAEDIKRGLRSRHGDSDGPTLQPLTEARHLVEEEGFKAADHSEMFGAIVEAVRIGMERGYKRVGELSGGDGVPIVPREDKPSKPSLNPTLSDAVERYLQERDPATKTKSETRLALRQFEEVVGRKSLAAITRQDAHLFVQHLSKQKVGGKTKGSIVRSLSEQSISKRLRMLGSAIYHARDTGRFNGDNLLANVRLGKHVQPTDRAVMPDKRRLQIGELNRIFAHPWFVGCKSKTETHLPGNYRLNGSEYWVPVVALLTGCRAGELGGLKLSEVRLDDDLPHLLIRNNEYRRTKNGRTRCVPVIDALMELGFPDYVERVRRSGATRLFPDWIAIKPAGGGEGAFPAWSNARIIRAFNRTVIPAALSGTLTPDVRREVTFHSLRGAFKAMIGTTNALPVNIVHEVVGHAKSELDSRYIGEVTIEETYPVVRACRYPGLVIPKPN